VRYPPESTAVALKWMIDSGLYVPPTSSLYVGVVVPMPTLPVCPTVSLAVFEVLSMSPPRASALLNCIELDALLDGVPKRIPLTELSEPRSERNAFAESSMVRSVSAFGVTPLPVVPTRWSLVEGVVVPMPI
jgi:hypothetical protein